jgi:hypothetical protein
LVLPLISIDEFNSKIDNRRAIVVAFYCTDKDPAQDLMRFIEGSNLDMLDTEVSPAPSSEGYYVVFVEFSRNREFPATLDEIIQQVGNIAENKWQLKIWNHDDIVHYSTDVIEKLVILDPSQIPPDPQDDQDPVKDVVDQAQAQEPPAAPAPVEEPVEPPAAPEEPAVAAATPPPPPIAEHAFYNQADIDRVIISNRHVVFHSGGTSRTYVRAAKMSEFGKLNLEETLNVRALRKLLGNQYQVYMYEHGIVVQRGADYRVLKES